MINGISSGSYAYSYAPYWSALAARGTTGTAGMARTVAIPAAQPEQPVTPVAPVTRITAASETTLDKADLLRRLETDPAAIAVRSRIQYLNNEDAEQPANELSDAPSLWTEDMENGKNNPAMQMKKAENAGYDKNPADTGKATEKTEKAPAVKDSESAQEVMQEAECQTCKARKYQDGSDDPGVSFKTAAHISPEQAASAVRSHEYEHVTREQAEAIRNDRKVVSQSVTYQTAICPECGRVYVSGGTTRTVTKGAEAPASQESVENQEGEDGFSVSP